MDNIETIDNILITFSIDSRAISLYLKDFLNLWQRKLIIFPEMSIEEFKVQWVVGALGAGEFFNMNDAIIPDIYKFLDYIQRYEIYG